MSAGGKGVKVVEEMIEGLRSEISERQIRLAALEDALRKMKGEPEPKSARGRRGINVKSYLLELLERQGAMGLNANQAVEIGAKEGKLLERGTVSSLLSRFKGDVAEYDGQVYKLKKYANTPMPGTRTENVVQHPASKAS